jgi:hypothetical protein
MRSEHGTSAALEYNLGNTRMRLGQFPEAVGHYRRAQWLNPNDPDLDANLDRALKGSGGRLPGLPPGRKLTGFLAPGTWRTMLVAVCWILAALLTLGRFVPRIRAAAPWTIPSMVAVLLVAAAGVWFSRPSPLEQEAVLTGGTVTARFEPLDDATAHFTLPGTSIVRVTDRTRDWLRITADGNQGWIHIDQALPLTDL